MGSQWQEGLARTGLNSLHGESPPSGYWPLGHTVSGRRRLPASQKAPPVAREGGQRTMSKGASQLFIEPNNEVAGRLALCNYQEDLPRRAI